VTILLGAWRWLGPAGRWAVGGALAVFLLAVGGLYALHVHDSRIRDAERLACSLEAMKAEAAGWAVIREKERALADLSSQLAAVRLAADVKDNERVDRVIKEVIYADPKAASCRFDKRLADRLNELRQ